HALSARMMISARISISTLTSICLLRTTGSDNYRTRSKGLSSAAARSSIGNAGSSPISRTRRQAPPNNNQEGSMWIYEPAAETLAHPKRCRCSADIVFVKTKAGKKAPLNAGFTILQRQKVGPVELAEVDNGANH